MSMAAVSVSDRRAVGVILALSAVILGFLFWLIYFQTGGEPGGATTSVLPAFNAFCNAVAAVFVAAGIVCIKTGRKRAHAVMMAVGTLASACFLVGYILYHNSHGHTVYEATGFIRTLYLTILLTHIVLAALVVPMILTTLYFAARQRFRPHRAIARWTYPVWLYVSITGIVVYLMLRW